MRSSKKEQDSIGIATMKRDGTIILILRAEDEAQTAIGIGRLEYAPGHPYYTQVRAHVGTIVVGEEKPVRPWD